MAQASAQVSAEPGRAGAGVNADLDAERRAEQLRVLYGQTGDAKIDQENERRNLHIQDQESVRDHLEQWASEFQCRDAADRKAVNEYLGRIQQPGMKPADLVKASDSFLKDIASRGVPEVRESAPRRTRVVDHALENISVATQAFASYKDVKVEDKYLFQSFLVTEHVDMAQMKKDQDAAAASLSTAVNRKPLPGPGGP